MKFKRFFLFFFSIILGIVAFIFILEKVGVDKVLQALSLFAWWHFLLLIFSVVLILFIYIEKWRVIAKPFNYKTNWRKLFVAFLGSQTISFIMPMMYVGGEGFKGLLLKEDDEQRSFIKTFGLIIVDKLAEVLALLFFFLLGGIMLIFYNFFLLGLLMILFSLVILVIFFWGIKATRFFLFFIKIFGFNKIIKDEEKRKEEVDAIENFLTSHRRLFIYDVVFSFFALVLSALQIYLMLFFLGLSASIFEIYLIKIATMLASLVPTPGSVGGFEGGIVLIFSFLNLPVQMGLALTIIMRALQFIEVGLGSILIFPYLASTIFKNKKTE